VKNTAVTVGEIIANASLVSHITQVQIKDLLIPRGISNVKNRDEYILLMILPLSKQSACHQRLKSK
jgi:hypothetical protein